MGAIRVYLCGLWTCWDENRMAHKSQFVLSKSNKNDVTEQ